MFKSKSTKEEFGELSEEDALEKMKLKTPKLIQHLLPFEQKAKKRYDKGDYWWELRNCAYYDLFEKPKIVFPNLQNANKFSFDETGRYINAPAVILPTDDKALLAILNSKLVWYFLTQICVVRSGGYIEVKPQYFEQIPIADYTNVKRDLQLFTEKQIQNVNQIQDIESNFINLLQSKFSTTTNKGLQPLEITKKLQNWHKLEYSVFLKELEKARKKSAKENETAYNKLTLGEEAQWMQYFNEQKQKAQELQTKIDKTDHEIDQMVYELYGLTDEEVAIVEEATA